MRILGIDPGPDGFAWALYDDKLNEIVEWGDKVMTGGDRLTINFDWAAIEEPALSTIPGSVKSLVNISFRVGFIAATLSSYNIPWIKINRKTIAQVLTGRVTSGDKEINRALGVLIPGFAKVRRGLTGHHRAAAACAFVAAGRVPR